MRYALAAAGMMLLAAEATAQQTTVSRERITQSSMYSSSIDSSGIGAMSRSFGYFATVRTDSAAIGEQIGGSGFNLLEMSRGGTPIRRGITWGADPQGDLTFWVNLAQGNASFNFRDGSTGNTWGSIRNTGWNGAVVGNVTGNLYGSVNGGSLNGSLLAINGSGSVTGNFTVGSVLNVTGAISTPANISGGGLITNGSAAVQGDVHAGTVHVDGAVTSTGAIVNGNVTVYGAVTSPTFNGALNGNAGTAAAFNHTPAVCPSDTPNNTFRLTGINADGSAICAAGPVSHAFEITGCTTGGSSYNTCNVPVTFQGFSDTTYAINCTAQNPGPDGRAVISGYTGKTNNSFTVIFATEGGAQATFSGADCTVQHN